MGRMDVFSGMVGRAPLDEAAQVLFIFSRQDKFP
jgi:hypothetical protein